MKKLKMIVSVFMAMVLMLSTFSVTAAAAISDDNIVSPQYEVAPCPVCGQSLRVRSSSTSRDAVEGRCELGGAMVHTHEYVTTIKKVVCPNCGEFVIDETVSKYCQGIKIRYNPD